MKIVVSNEEFLQYAAEIEGMENTIEKWWWKERIHNFKNMNGKLLHRIRQKQWEITADFYQTEEYDDGKGNKGKRVVTTEEASKIVALGEGEKVAKKPKRVPLLQEGKTQEEFNAAVDAFMKELVEIHV